MKEERRQISLKLGDATLDNRLGIYYIDMRPAIIHYEENIYNGGFDNNGVPFCRYGNGNINYSTVNICQYAFMIHANYLEKKNLSDLAVLKACLAKLECLKFEDENIVKWIKTERNERYGINPPWTSAMDCGQAISFYLRMYQLIGDTSFLHTAMKIYNFLKVDVKDGGVRRIDEKGNLWFEEYPSTPPSYVLNGFIYTIFGLYDLFRVSNDIQVKKDIDACILTLNSNLHNFDSGYWSNYDLLKKELVRYYYQKNVHVPQLQALYLLTQESKFNYYSQKWKKTLNPINYFFVRIMYRVRPRFQKYFGVTI
jgi:heparosan-N-sulfate-glucuronate 5-epimerase